MPNLQGDARVTPSNASDLRSNFCTESNDLLLLLFKSRPFAISQEHLGTAGVDDDFCRLGLKRMAAAMDHV